MLRFGTHIECQHLAIQGWRHNASETENGIIMLRAADTKLRINKKIESQGHSGHHK